MQRGIVYVVGEQHRAVRSKADLRCVAGESVITTYPSVQRYPSAAEHLPTRGTGALRSVHDRRVAVEGLLTDDLPVAHADEGRHLGGEPGSLT